GTVASPNGLSAPFSITSDNCSGQTVATGGSCTVQVQFAPTAEGDFSDTFTFPILAPVTASFSVSTAGSATALPTCDDEIQNGEETDVDCGGSTCEACSDGSGCGVAGDCGSGV